MKIPLWEVFKKIISYMTTHQAFKTYNTHNTVEIQKKMLNLTAIATFAKFIILYLTYIYKRIIIVFKKKVSPLVFRWNFVVYVSHMCYC